jgi:hypothetical protein
MRDEAEVAVEVAALDAIATAVTVLLERLRAASDPTERAAIGAEFIATIDRIRADLAARHGLGEGRSGAIVARSLARVIEAVRAAPSSG